MGILEVLLLIVYGGGAWKFWNGFDRTNFTANRVPLTLLWPLLLAFNSSYRQNFSKAFKK